MKILKKLMIVILITNIIIFSLIPTKVVRAESNQEIVANAIVEKARNLQSNFGQQTVSELNMDSDQFVTKVIKEAIDRNFDTTTFDLYESGKDTQVQAGDIIMYDGRANGIIAGIATGPDTVIIFNRNPNNTDRADDTLVEIKIADFGSGSNVPYAVYKVKPQLVDVIANEVNQKVSSVSANSSTLTSSETNDKDSVSPLDAILGIVDGIVGIFLNIFNILPVLIGGVIQGMATSLASIGGRPDLVF